MGKPLLSLHVSDNVSDDLHHPLDGVWDHIETREDCPEQRGWQGGALEHTRNGQGSPLPL